MYVDYVERTAEHEMLEGILPKSVAVRGNEENE